MVPSDTCAIYHPAEAFPPHTGEVLSGAALTTPLATSTSDGEAA
jgi:hypothetical protein